MSSILFRFSTVRPSIVCGLRWPKSSVLTIGLHLVPGQSSFDSLIRPALHKWRPSTKSAFWTAAWMGDFLSLEEDDSVLYPG